MFLCRPHLIYALLVSPYHLNAIRNDDILKSLAVTCDRSVYRDTVLRIYVDSRGIHNQHVTRPDKFLRFTPADIYPVFR